jgi:ABC-type multidrug transport system fused ATPase/permease subunit
MAAIYFWPNMLPVAVFSTYIYTGHYLSLGIAVASMILFKMMEAMFGLLPWWLKMFFETLVAFRRIQSFLLCDEVQKNIHERKENSTDETILSVNGTFSWGFQEKGQKKEETKEESKADNSKVEDQPKKEEEKPARKINSYLQLQNIDLQVKRGEFVCIIGDVGAGKTSLLKAIVGDMMFVPDSEIEQHGGKENVLDQAGLDEWRKKLLHHDFWADEKSKPISISGSLAYVE